MNEQSNGQQMSKQQVTQEAWQKWSKNGAMIATTKRQVKQEAGVMDNQCKSDAILDKEPKDGLGRKEKMEARRGRAAGMRHALNDSGSWLALVAHNAQETKARKNGTMG